jgi:hypothetical protein
MMTVRVVDADEGNGLAGAQLIVVPYGAPAYGADLQTDANGNVSVPIPSSPFDGLSIWAAASGHVPKVIRWHQSELALLPADYTVKLERGAAIDGTVQDAQGQPIANAQVAVSSPGIDLAARENISFHPRFSFVFSDRDGRWAFDIIPRNFEDIGLLLTHPEFSRTRASLSVRGTSATNRAIVMSRGVKVSGLVMSGKGAPVSGATVEEIHNFSGPQLSTQTGEDGRFLFAHVKPEPMKLTIKAAGFAPLTRTVEVSTNGGELKFELSEGKLLLGRVVDEKDEPVPGAKVATSGDMFGIDDLQWSTKTDSDGRFVWDSAPAFRVNYRIFASGYSQSSEASLVADGTEHIVRLKKVRTLLLSGSVVDEANRQSIPRFNVLLDEMRGTAMELIGEGTEGTFRLSFDDHGFFTSYRVQIKTEGYQPEISDPVRVGDGDQHFSFSLTKTVGISSVVHLPDGQAAVGAEVCLCGNGFGAMMYEPGRLRLSRQEVDKRTVTDSAGRFHFRAILNAEHIMVAHEEGCAVVLLSELTNAPVVLRPWGQIEGTLMVGSQPGANQTVGVEPRLTSAEQHFSFSYRNKTDANGRFTFGKVPPGEGEVYRYIGLKEGISGKVGLSHHTKVEVLPGQTAQVTLGGIGRPIIGRVTVTPAGQAVDWTRDLQRLILERPDQPRLRREDFADERSFVLAMRRQQREQRTYYPVFNPDGSFRVDDVPGGNYKLVITLTEPPRDPLDRNRFLLDQKVIGTLSQEVVVAGIAGGRSDEPLDLGALELKLRPESPQN